MTDGVRTEPRASGGAADEPPDARAAGTVSGNDADRRTRVTVLVALAANPVTAAAKVVGGLLSGSPAPLSGAAPHLDITNAPPRGGV
ncbi:hypothetical protein OG233_29735 [Streptomyces sp. NBC_01218]|uniref:hypothetical protein n=1 Tax=unclassified Streptomyces TaxID=2593676 RepID=UPI002E15C4C7|nr:hypothetical protein OG233_29735 [Streptomyces sp. NBC_01218]